MLDYVEHKPRNRSYFASGFRVQKDEWMSIILTLAAYLMTMGIGYVLYPR